MKRQILLCIVLVYFSSCAESQIGVNDVMNYPWIPKQANGKDGSFETLYFYNDSSFLKITSTQVLTEKDSISFMSEPGFILYSGKYNVLKGTNEIALRYRLLHRTFRLTGKNCQAIILMKEYYFIHPVKTK